ncbi:MAG: T9SS type A sorting domain-containing protein [Bacteroidetes bacterium]|nr:T9SS type A sorting domain-containing protein [Bacteroidota bacterium]
MCTTGSLNCDLLPDVMVATQPLQTIGTYGVMEYAYNDLSSKKSQLRVSVSTPNIGRGPLEVRATNTYVCGTDTIIGTAPTVCVNTGLPPKQLLVQRVYRKEQDKMVYYERKAGSMTYHPTHGHMHVDDWGIYTLRKSTSNPDPLTWPIITQGTKLAFCLMDYGYCSTYNQHCKDTNGTILTNLNTVNYGLGGGAYSCSNVLQGISVGYLDIYYQYLDGMQMMLDSNICNGDYWLVVQIDPNNNFIESNENNNVVAVPFTLTKQRTRPDVQIVSGKTTICKGESVSFGANGASNYTWKASNGNSTTMASALLVSPQVTTTYTVIGTNIGEGCSDTNYVTINVNNNPTVSIPGNSTICPGQSSNLTVSGAACYMWNPNINNNDSLATLVTATPSSTTTYNVTGINANGCSSTSSFTVNVSKPTLSSNVSNVTICQTTSQAFVVTGASTYTWVPTTGLSSSTASNVTCTPPYSTTYTVTGTDAFGCTGTTSISVQILPNPYVSITPLATSYLNTVTSVALQGYPANGIFSGPGVSGSIFNPYNLIPGSYVVKYEFTDNNGCKGQALATTSVAYSCSKPTGIVANNITANSAKLNWGVASSGPQFKIKYKKNSSTIWNTITINGNPHVVSTVLTGLDPSTVYNYNIKPNCGSSTNQSITYNFTTLANKPLSKLFWNDIVSSSLINIYPNPNSGRFTMQFESDIVQEGRVQIIDVSGRIVYTSNIDIIEGMNEMKIDVTNVAAGVYAAQLIIARETITTKMIIE